MKQSLCKCARYRKICPAAKRIRRAWAVALVVAGETYITAASLSGVGHGNIQNYLREAGVPLEGRGRYQQRLKRAR